MLEELNFEEFNNFSKNHNQGTFYESSYYGNYKLDLGFKVNYLGFKQNNEIKAATLLVGIKTIFGKYIYYSPRGFLIDYTNYYLLEKFVEEIKKYVKKNKGIFIRINPYVEYRKRDLNGNVVDEKTNQNIIDKLEHLGFVKDKISNKWLSVLELENKSEEDILKNLLDDTKKCVNNSYKHGLELIELTEFEEIQKVFNKDNFKIKKYKKLYEIFGDKIKFVTISLNIENYLNNLQNQKNELLLKQVEAKNMSVRNKSYLNELVEQLSYIDEKINTLNILLESKGKIIVIASGIFVLYGSRVYSLYSDYSDEYERFNGCYFLHFKMIKYALNNGYKEYSFGKINPCFEENIDPKFDFARGFNSRVVELIGDYYMITNKFFYKLYKLFKK